MIENNHVFMGIDGRRIDIQITATSEEQAKKIYELIKQSLVGVMRINLETELSRDDGGTDRP